ncbi:MAG: helix-turn-helix domain-containing protein [Akkermansiaceae bacterium]
MKLIDTTDRRSEVGVRSLFSCSEEEPDVGLAGKFRIHLRGFFSATVGAEWDSKGRRESDFLHHIEMPLSGKRSIVHHGEIYHLEPGEIWFLPGNTPVERQCTSKCDLLFFKLSCEWLPGVDPLLDWKDRGPRKIGHFQPEEWLPWRKINRHYSMSDLLILRGTILFWLAKALPELDDVIRNHLATHMQFNKAFSLMESQLGADIRLSSLAEAQGMSVDAFSASFVRNIGIGPKEYISRRINEKALALVTYGDMKMKQIAEILRFNDEFYFSRFFKKMNGRSPSVYREEMRKMFTGASSVRGESVHQG